MSPAPTLYGSRQARHAAGHTRIGPLVGGALCLDVANTIEDHHGAGGADQLGSGYVNVLDWFTQAGALDAETARRLGIRAGKEPREAAAVRKRLIALRAALYDVVTALIDDREPPGTALATLNGEAALARAGERLVPDGPGLTWQEAFPVELDIPVRAVARSAAELLTSPRSARIRQCEGPTCQRLFVDTSKNGSRRYCSSSGCGSAERVRRFRERHRADT